MSKIFLLLLFFSASLVAPAQNPWFRELKIDPQYESQGVNAIAQIRSGLMFFGTDTGLYSFDGFRFENMELPEGTGVAHVSHISHVDQDALWIGMKNGVLLRWKQGRLKKMSSPARSPVRSVISTADSSLWMATYGEGLFYWKNGRWRRFTGIPDPYVYQLIEHPSGKLLAGTDLGLVVIDPQARPISFRLYNAQNGLPDNIVRSLGLMKDGNVLVGFQEKGIYVFNLQRQLFHPVPGGEVPVTCMTRLRNEFWIGTDQGQIIDYEFSGDRRTRIIWPSDKVIAEKITALYHDLDGNIWIATDQRLFFSPGEKIEFISSYRQQRMDSIQALTSGNDGEIWFSNPKGLFRYDYLALPEERIRKFPLTAGGKELHIVSLYMDKSGFLWIGTFDNGLFRLNPASGQVKRFGPGQGLPNANVISIAGNDSAIWLATLEGLVRCSISPGGTENNGYEYVFSALAGKGSISPGFVYCIYIDSKGRTWFGTDGNGLLFYENGRLHSLESDFSSRMRFVYSITEDREGSIWISTQNNGLFRYNGSYVRQVSLKQGLSNLDVKGITTDRYGNVVVINAQGIDIINPATLEVVTLGREAGLETLSADISTIARDRKGVTWFGTREGLYRFNNDNQLFQRKPRLMLRGIYTFMKQDVSFRDSVFDYNQNHVSFHYVGLWYPDPDGVSYRYRLKGYSNDWISTRDQVVTFPNLLPGNYVFEVMAGLNGQFRDPPVLRYDFRIRKPLWKENWFIFSLVAVLTGLAYLYLRERDIRLRRIEGLKKEKIEYQFATLRSQINPHFLFNSFNTLIAVIEEDRVRAVEYVEKLSDYFRNMLIHRDQETISLRQEMTMVDNYFYLQHKRFGDSLSLSVAIPSDWYDQFSLPPLSLQLLIENAVKHNAVSHETPLRISVEASGQDELRITNNLNPKKHPEPSTGIGLDNISSRFRMLTDRNVRIHKGSNYYSVVIPLIKIRK